MAIEKRRFVTGSVTQNNTGTLIIFNSASAITYTLLAATGTGRQETLINIGAGKVTVAPYDEDTILGESYLYLQQGALIDIYDVASEAWWKDDGSSESESFYTVSDPGVSAATTAAIIDGYAGVVITTTTTGNAQTLASPTVTYKTQHFTVTNNDTSTNSVTVNDIIISVGDSQTFLWDGTAWSDIDVNINPDKEINLTLTYDLSSSATYAKAIYATQTLTGEDSGGGGGMQGIRCDTNNADYDNLWQVSIQGRATVSNATINDAIGVYGSVKTVGTVSKYQASSALCALKGDVSDSPGSTWDAQVFGLMLGYASQINYGGDTALIFGYTHATAYCDYGILFNNYSPNMLSGIKLTETAGATPAMDYGIYIDANCGTAIHLAQSYSAAVAADYPKSIYSVQAMTAAGGGGLQGIRSDTNNASFANAWQVSLQGRATATGTATVGDTIGCYAAIKTVGALTANNSTDSLCAYKGDVSDSPGSAWNANVHGIMLGYASQINYGGKTSLFFGYTHATAYCDYGLLIDNYSPNMAAGIYLTETTGATPDMGTGLLIDSNCSSSTIALLAAAGTGFNVASVLIAGDQAGTALAYGSSAASICTERVNATAQITGGNYWMGRYAQYATSGSFGATGFIMGNYSKVTVAHLVQEVYAQRGRVSITANLTGDTGNQYIGSIGYVDVAASLTLALADTGGIYGVLGHVDVGASTTCDQPIQGGYFDTSLIKSNIAGETSCVKLRAGGGSDSYTDYGLNVELESNNILAAMYMATKTSCVCPIGLHFNATSGSITTALSFTGTSTYLADFSGSSGAAGTITTDSGSAATSWKARIKVKTDDGTDAWINCYSTSGE